MQELLASKLQQEVTGKLDKCVAIDFEAISCEVVEFVRKNHGGEPVYIPKAAAWQCKQKHNRIFEEFNGGNHHALAEKFSLSLSQIYRIVQSKSRRQKISTVNSSARQRTSTRSRPRFASER